MSQMAEIAAAIGGECSEPRPPKATDRTVALMRLRISHWSGPISSADAAPSTIRSPRSAIRPKVTPNALHPLWSVNQDAGVR